MAVAWKGCRLCVGEDEWVSEGGVWEQATEDRWPGDREQETGGYQGISAMGLV